MFDFVTHLLKRKKHDKVAVEQHRSKRQESLNGIMHKLTEIEGELTEKNAKEKCKEFYSLVKAAFKESLNIKYEVTIQEIQSEIQKKGHYSQSLREEVDSFLSEIGLMEYGYPEFRELLRAEKDEKERRLAEYLGDLDKKGAVIKDDTRKKIASIVSESIPHNDRDLLLRSIKQYKAIVHRII